MTLNECQSKIKKLNTHYFHVQKQLEHTYDKNTRWNLEMELIGIKDELRSLEEMEQKLIDDQQYKLFE